MTQGRNVDPAFVSNNLKVGAITRESMKMDANTIYIPEKPAPSELTCREALNLSALTSNISALMVKATSETLDNDIITSIEKICRVLAADRGGLLEISEEAPNLHVSHPWYGEGIPQVSEEIDLSKVLPWTSHQLIDKGRTLAISQCSALPDEASVDRETAMSLGVKSSLIIPLFMGNSVHHLMVFDAMASEREWSDDVIDSLRLLGEIFVSALQRRDSESLLRKFKDRLDIAAESADVGLWELNLESNRFWATSKARTLFGFTDNEPICLDDFLEKVYQEDCENISNAIGQLSCSRRELNVVYRSLGRGGELRWMHSMGRIREPENGHDTLLMGVTLDVSRQKQMEEKLQQQLTKINQLRERLKQENEYLRSEVTANSTSIKPHVSSRRMRAIMDQVDQVARADSTVLIQGETGTGKELIAHAIHQRSDRNNRVMVKVNCAALPMALVESELFGREKGAFTGALSKQSGRFELADGSTLFLDEVSEMPLDTQVKLLRVLQEGEYERLGSPRLHKVDVRIIAATNRDLLEEVDKGRFRRDLFYRLNVFPLQVPALRERIDDVLPLVWEFVHEFGNRMGKKVSRIAPEDMERLLAYSWPGNVRELRNVIERAMISSNGDTLVLQHLTAESQITPHTNKPMTLEDVERQHIQDVLKMTGGRIKGASGAAAILNLPSSTLYSRMHKLGIQFKRS